MKTEIKVPSMGESISEATIGAILKPSGSNVKADDEIPEIETDKVNQVLLSPQAGSLTLTVAKDDVVKIGQVIGYIEEGNKAVTSSPKETISPSIPPNEQPADSKKVETPQTESKKIEDPPGKEEVKKEAETKKVQDDIVKSYDYSSRYQKEDFVKELQQKPTGVPPTLESKPSLTKKEKEAKERETRKPMSKIRSVIASRMVESLQNTAMLTTFNEVDMTEIIRLREKFKDQFQKTNQTKLGFMSFFVKAVVFGLSKVPELNSYIEGNEIVHREYVDVGVAVGTDRGVIVPVLRDCDQLNFAEIEKNIEDFAAKARQGKITYDELKGGGFTITNGGIYGSLLSTPILSPNQSGILGMHKIEKRPVVVDDQIVIKSMMYIALSYDHRIVDGKEAVTFLVHVKNSLEDPVRLLMGV